MVKVTALGHRQDVGLIQFVVFWSHWQVVGFCRMQGRKRSAQLSDTKVLIARVPPYAVRTSPKPRITFNHRTRKRHSAQRMKVEKTVLHV